MRILFNLQDREQIRFPAIAAGALPKLFGGEGNRLYAEETLWPILLQKYWRSQ